ncbi:MAG: hypothetical protein ACK54Q_07535, partial [Alphaproteobacteria bacterium]
MAAVAQDVGQRRRLRGRVDLGDLMGRLEALPDPVHHPRTVDVMGLDDQPHARQGRSEVGTQKVILRALDVDNDQATTAGEALEVYRLEEPAGVDPLRDAVHLRHCAAGLQGGCSRVVREDLGPRRDPRQADGVIAFRT